MGTVTGYTAAHMQELVDENIVDGHISGNNLILEKRGGGEINAGNVRGAQGVPGPPGDLSDSPHDGHKYMRKDGLWVQLYETPTDGKKYAVKDNALVEVERIWKLEFANGGAAPPAGFSLGALTAGAAWSVSFVGVGKVVHYKLVFAIDGTAVSNSPRMTFPAELRPVVEDNSIGLFTYIGYGGPSESTSLCIYGTDGTILTPQVVPGLMGSEPSGDFAEGKITVYDGSKSVKVFLSGTYIRASSDLPSTAAWI